MRVARQQLADVRDEVQHGNTGRLLLNVLPSSPLDVVVERTVPIERGYTLSGRIAGDAMGFVTMVVHEEAVAASIWTPQAAYELSYLGGHVHALRDVTKAPPFQCGGASSAELPMAEATKQSGTDDGSVVDILVVWTPAAEERYRGEPQVLSIVDMSIAYTNDAFERSGAFVSLRLVGAEKVDYQELDGFLTDLGRLRDPDDGHMDGVHDQRDALGADLVYLLTASGSGAASFLNPFAVGAYLHVNDNEIADLSPVNFTSLRELLVRNNALQDLSPLLNGDELLMVDVRRNPLADDALAVLDTLRERRVTVLAGETVPYLPAADHGRQGFVRIVNRSDVDGHVFIEAVDDAGVRAGPLRLDVGARRAVHFNSTDLEHGNARKGLGGGVGAPTAGDWRLSVISALDVEVLSYVRTEDGFVTAMHDVVADAVLPTFNPGSNQNQRSILRVVNTEAERAKWTTGGYDDRGRWHPMAGSIEVRPGTALTLSAAALENAHGLGDGQGKWRLRVRGFPWFAMSLLESPTGHLTNLSTAPDHSAPLPDGGRLHRLPLFPAASAGVGFARVINRSDTAGQVVIEAVDDNGTRFGPVSLDLGPRRTVHFNSRDLEAGNAAKGLSGGVGMGDGDWRLELASTLDLQVLSYIRTADGFLTSMHDLAPRAEDGSLWIPFFNPGRNTNQASSLRLINRGEGAAEVTITGVDDAGDPSSDAVRVSIPTGAVRTFTAAELETGSATGLSGALGEGEGKWRLRVATSDEVDAMSLLSLPTGHTTNLSTTPRPPRRANEE